MQVAMSKEFGGVAERRGRVRFRQEREKGTAARVYGVDTTRWKREGSGVLGPGTDPSRVGEVVNVPDGPPFLLRQPRERNPRSGD